MFHQFASVLAILHAGDFAAAKSSTKSSDSSGIFIILLFVVLIAYFWIRPQRRRMRQQQMTQRDFEIGDEVVTTSGIVGRAQAINGNRVDLEIAPGTTIQVLSQAIARRAEPNITDEYDGAGHPDDAHHEEADDDADKDQGATPPDSSKWWPQTGQTGASDTEPGGSS